MSASPTARILTFPPRPRVQPHAIDLSRAVPADDAMVERLRAQTSEVIAAYRADDRAELVSALLMQLEAHPLAACLTYPSRDIVGKPFVHVVAAGVNFRLLPEDCRTAAAALIADPAFPGCVGVAGDLREAAAMAEARRTGCADRLEPPARAGGNTGGGTVIALSLLILATVALTLWAGH